MSDANVPEDAGFLPVSLILEAVDQLRTGFNNDQAAAAERWLLAKYMGAVHASDEPEVAAHPAKFGIADCQRFQRDWFEIDPPGIEAEVDGEPIDYGVFEPFKAAYLKRGPKTKWYLNTLWSSFDRGKLAKKLMTTTESEDKVKSAAFTPDYLDVLEDTLGGEIRFVDLAVWRFRHAPLPQGTSLDALMASTVAELHLSSQEVAAVFTDSDDAPLGSETDQ